MHPSKAQATGGPSATPANRKRRPPAGVLIVGLYAAAALLLHQGLVRTGGPDLWLYLLIAPIVPAALYPRRWLYLTLTVIAVAVSGATLVGMYENPARGLRSVAAAGVTACIASEIVYRLTRGRLRTEESLRRATERLQALVGSSPLAILGLDLAGNVVSWNAAAQRMLGWSEEEVTRRRVPFVPDERAEAFADLYRRVLGGETLTDVEERCRTRDGREVDVSISAAPLHNAEGLVNGLIAVLADVTVRRQAAEAARRLIQEQTAREHADEERKRHAFLAEASRALGSSLDYRATFEQLVRLAVPRLADYCAVDVLDERDGRKRLAVAYTDAAMESVLGELGERFPTSADEPRGIAKVLRTGEPEVYPEFPDEVLQSISRSEEHLALLRRLGLRSYLCLPLVARERILGSVTLAYTDSGRRYGPEEIALAEELAGRAAIAIDNARLYQEVRSADRAKDEFLAMLAHELRNPLAAISNAGFVLDHAELDSAQGVRLREIIRRQSEHLSRLVDDLMDVSRITRGKVELRMAPVDLGAVVARAVEAARARIETRGIDLTATVAEGVWVNGDATRLEQITANLLSNAARFTPAGGRVEVCVGREVIGGQPSAVSRQRSAASVHPSNEQPATCSEQYTTAVLRVRDTGKGIAPELLPRVFELFVQGDQTLDRSHGGLGIGLTLVHRLVALHGGAVRAESEGPGRGSTFTVTLPASEPAAAPARETPHAARPVPLRVLVVDDSPDVVETLGDMIEIWGHEVRTARSGPTALVEAESFGPDVALLDIGLPGMDGYELAGRLQGGPMLVAITGYGTPEARQRSAEAGFDHHLVKPVDPDQLNEILSGVPAAAR
jgi:PAS domain S-box-containing protein